MNFKLFQIDVKSTFLNGLIKKKIYVEQHLSFENQKLPNYVFKLKKILYGLKQTSRAWYDRISSY